MRMHIVKIFLVIMVLGTAHSSFAERTLNVSTMALPPFGFMTEQNEPSGIYSDIVKYLTQKNGISCANRVVPYDQAIMDLKNGKADILIMYPNERVEEFGIRVAPIITLTNIVIGRAGTKYKSIDDLQGKTVASVRGAKYDVVLSADRSIKKHETKDYQQNFSLLFDNQVDAVVGSDKGLFYVANELGYTRDQLGTPLVLNTRQPYLYFSKKTADESLIIALKEAINTSKYKRKIEAIVEVYLGDF